ACRRLARACTKPPTAWWWRAGRCAGDAWTAWVTTASRWPSRWRRSWRTARSGSTTWPTWRHPSPVSTAWRRPWVSACARAEPAVLLRVVDAEGDGDFNPAFHRSSVAYGGFEGPLLHGIDGRAVEFAIAAAPHEVDGARAALGVDHDADEHGAFHAIAVGGGRIVRLDAVDRDRFAVRRRGRRSRRGGALAGATACVIGRAFALGRRVLGVTDIDRRRRRLGQAGLAC